MNTENNEAALQTVISQYQYAEIEVSCNVVDKTITVFYRQPSA